MVVHHLEMETDEEELESLTAEVNNGRKVTANNSNNKLAHKKSRVLLGLGSVVAILLLIVLSGSSDSSSTPNFSGDSRPEDVEYKHVKPTTGASNAATDDKQPHKQPTTQTTNTVNQPTTPTTNTDNQPPRPAFSFAVFGKNGFHGS